MFDASSAEATRCAPACGCVTVLAVEDLQGPVAELRGYLEALSRSERGADARLVEAARDAGDRVRDVVDALVAYADADRPAEPRPIQLGPVVAAAAETVVEDLRARGAELTVAPLPQVVADPRQLYRAMVVLLRLVARAGAVGSALTVSALRCGDEWQLRVGSEVHSSDAPAGDRLGELPSGGVELQTAQRVAESHGGRLWVAGPDDPPTVWLAFPDREHKRSTMPSPESRTKVTQDD